MPGKHIYEVDDAYFSIPTIESCYWAGFLAADGCSHPEMSYPSGGIRQNRHISLTLEINDLPTLEKFKKAVEFTGAIGRYPANGEAKIASISINSRQMVDDLLCNFNVSSRKAFSLAPPDLYNENFSLAFICGLFDGDGSLYYVKRDNTHGVGFNGTEAICNWVKNYFDEKCPTHKKYALVRKAGRTSKTYKYDVIGNRARDMAYLMETIPFVPRMERKMLCVL